MKTIIVDDEPWMLVQFEADCARLEDIQLLGSFNDPLDALEFAKTNHVELAFLDIKMPMLNGLELARELRYIHPRMVIIFVSGYDCYMNEAVSMDADYYVMKPYTTETLRRVIERAKLLAKRQSKRVFIKTFGSFDVFVDGKPLEFSSSKAKELLAYLVDRNGALVDSEQGFSVLWEDKCYDLASASCYRKAVSRLHNILRDKDVLDILYVLPHGRAINKAMVDCDYYSFLDGKAEAINSWNGEYMSNYSWGEFTLGNLLETRNSFKQKSEY